VRLENVSNGGIRTEAKSDKNELSNFTQNETVFSTVTNSIHLQSIKNITDFDSQRIFTDPVTNSTSDLNLQPNFFSDDKNESKIGQKYFSQVQAENQTFDGKKFRTLNESSNMANLELGQSENFDFSAAFVDKNLQSNENHTQEKISNKNLFEKSESFEFPTTILTKKIMKTKSLNINLRMKFNQ